MTNSIRPKHYAVVTSQRRQTFMCPVCGVLGGLDEVIKHTIRWQWSDSQMPLLAPPPPLVRHGHP